MTRKFVLILQQSVVILFYGNYRVSRHMYPSVYMNSFFLCSRIKFL